MALRCGVDTSVLVRLVVGEPRRDFEHCVSELGVLVEEQGYEVFASNQVIGEAYAALIHHYGIDGTDACSGLRDVLTSGLVAPLNGQAVLDALAADSAHGLFDRLIIDDYAHAGLETLTLDQGMALLPNARRLGG